MEEWRCTLLRTKTFARRFVIVPPPILLKRLWAVRTAYAHTGGGLMVGSGVGPGSGRPLPVKRETARTVMS
jgi:hypothetical protein